MKQVKAMYRRGTILASIISMEMLFESRFVNCRGPLGPFAHFDDVCDFVCIFGAASLVVLAGFSRTSLATHFLTDVLAAIIFGII
jgi:hypothetical protein